MQKYKKARESVSIKQKQDGFTLIEMVIVIAVVGILMGIAFNGIRGVQSSARDTKRLSDLRSVQSYLELYFNKCGHYPGTASCGVSALSGTTGYASMKTALEGSVANTNDLPNDPQSGAGKSYSYNTDTNNYSYVISATMEKTAPQGGLSSTLPDGVSPNPACTTDKVYCISN